MRRGRRRCRSVAGPDACGYSVVASLETVKMVESFGEGERDVLDKIVETGPAAPGGA